MARPEVARVVVYKWRDRNGKSFSHTQKGEQKMASNYRPVSITSIVCRTMEKILRDNMASFLVENNLLSNYQFGFIKGRSTTLQLLNALNDWTQTIESKNFTDCIYMDYQKAFDKVPHNRLTLVVRLPGVPGSPRRTRRRLPGVPGSKKKKKFFFFFFKCVMERILICW